MTFTNKQLFSTISPINIDKCQWTAAIIDNHDLQYTWKQGRDSDFPCGRRRSIDEWSKWRRVHLTSFCNWLPLQYPQSLLQDYRTSPLRVEIDWENVWTLALATSTQPQHELRFHSQAIIYFLFCFLFVNDHFYISKYHKEGRVAHNRSMDYVYSNLQEDTINGEKDTVGGTVRQQW